MTAGTVPTDSELLGRAYDEVQRLHAELDAAKTAGAAEVLAALAAEFDRRSQAGIGWDNRASTAWANAAEVAREWAQGRSSGPETAGPVSLGGPERSGAPAATGGHSVTFTKCGFGVEHPPGCTTTLEDPCAYHLAVRRIAAGLDPDMLGSWRITAIDSEGLPSLERAELVPR